MSLDRSPGRDRLLSDLIGELAGAPTPDYLEAAIERASSRPQRPAWTFPGRWLPMADFATARVPISRAPWRPIVVLTLIAILLASVAAVYIGTQPRRLPEPFGLAGNGVIAVARDGDIVTVDSETGVTATIVGGPEVDGAPAYSPDGATIGFERAVEGRDDLRLLMVANADGSGVVQATPEPLSELRSWSFSPDGRQLLVTSRIAGPFRISIVSADGSGEPRVLDLRLPTDTRMVEAPHYRPPDGLEILVMATPPGALTRAIYVIDVASGQTRTVVEPPAPNDVYGATWSPDGDWIAYGQFDPSGTITARVHVIAADGSGERLVDTVADTSYSDWIGWSNDSTRMLILRGYASDGSDDRIAAVGLDPTTRSVELDCGPLGLATCDGGWTWSPDDTQLLGVVDEGVGPDRYLKADPGTGIVTEAPWSATGHPSWQRIASPD